MKKIGLVVPCYNEEATIKTFFRTTERVFRKMNKHGIHYDHEYLFINDGSADKTLLILRHLHESNPKIVHYISFSRNFGKEAGMTAGFNNVKGDYVAEMDVDLQDPPSLLPKMVKYLQHGYDCVGCIQDGRKQSKLRASLSRSFYQFMNRISSVHIVPNVRDFRLMTRQFLNSYLSLHERNRFTKGLFSWVGFKVKFLHYKARGRSAGTSDWSISSLFQYALEAIIDFSDIPLRIATYAGSLLCFLASLGWLIDIIALAISGTASVSLALAGLIMLVGGIQLLCLGIIGKYIGKTYGEVKHRPLYVIREEK